jgi:hypothetical protein
MRRRPVIHPISDSRRLDRRAVIALGGAAAGAIGVAGGLLAANTRAGAAEPPGRPARGDSDDGGLTPHREAYYRRARF